MHLPSGPAERSPSEREDRVFFSTRSCKPLDKIIELCARGDARTRFGTPLGPRGRLTPLTPALRLVGGVT